MKVHIKDGPGGCTGHGRCFVLSPDVYRLDFDGYNADRGSTINVATGDEKAARLAVQSCPERAIIIVED